jgi:hypothetical protein
MEESLKSRITPDVAMTAMRIHVDRFGWRFMRHIVRGRKPSELLADFDSFIEELDEFDGTFFPEALERIETHGLEDDLRWEDPTPEEIEAFEMSWITPPVIHEAMLMHFDAHGYPGLLGRVIDSRSLVEILRVSNLAEFSREISAVDPDLLKAARRALVKTGRL